MQLIDRMAWGAKQVWSLPGVSKLQPEGHVQLRMM